MKRIQTACLSQTIHFQFRPEISQEIGEEEVKNEYQKYKATLERNKTKYKIIDEQLQADGSIIVKIKKQINQYDVGDYLN